MSTLGPYLREIRKQAGLTQVELSSKIGLNQGQISNIENGKRDTTTAVLLRWVQVCGYQIAFVGPEHAELQQAASRLKPSELRLAIRLVQALPEMDSYARSLLEAMLKQKR